MSEVVLDQELTKLDADQTREWLRLPAGKPLMKYIKQAIKLHHGGVVSELSANPLRDVLATQRSVGAEQALVQLLEAIKVEVESSEDS
jgi:hypothetical protein